MGRMGEMGDVSRLNRDAHYWGLKPFARDNLLGGRKRPGAGQSTKGTVLFMGRMGNLGRMGIGSRGNRDTHWKGGGAKAAYTGRRRGVGLGRRDDCWRDGIGDGGGQ